MSQSRPKPYLSLILVVSLRIFWYKVKSSFNQKRKMEEKGMVNPVSTGNVSIKEALPLVQKSPEEAPPSPVQGGSDLTLCTGKSGEELLKVDSRASILSQQREIPEVRARALMAEEAAYWSRAVPEMVNSHESLVSTGNNYALAALARNPRLGAEISAFFAGNFLLRGLYCLMPRKEDLDYLQRCGTSEAQQKAVAQEISRFTDFILSASREHETSPMLFAPLTQNICKLITSQPGVGCNLDQDQLKKLSTLLQGSLLSSRWNDDERSRDWETASKIAGAAAQLHKETEGSLPVEWLLDWLGKRDHCAAIYLETAVTLGRKIPGEVLEAAKSQTRKAIKKQSEKNFFYNQDWFAGRLKLLHDAFDARNDTTGRMELARELLTLTEVKGLRNAIANYLEKDNAVLEPPPDFRMKVGDQEFEFGTKLPVEPMRLTPPPYEPLGATDRKEAVERMSETRLIGAEDFWEKAGDQAILALGDPQFKEAASSKWVELLQKKGVGNFLARDVLSRLSQLKAVFPKECDAAGVEFVNALEKAILKGGEAAEEITYYLDTPVLSRDDKLRLLSAEVETHRRSASNPGDDTVRNDAVVQRRGILFYAITDMLDSCPFNDLPDQSLVGLNKVFEDSCKAREEAFAERDKEMNEYRDNWKEEGTTARSLLGIKQ